MKHAQPAVFLNRENRFVATVRLNNEEVVCHVKNTGRCRELLISGARVWLRPAENPTRRTRYDLCVVEKQGTLINIDSQEPNRTAAAYLHMLFPNARSIRSEVTFGDSRFDFYLELPDGGMLVEVKGVTLEENGVAYFPDAPTSRGVKHLRGLISAVEQGYRAMVLFVVQMKGVRYMMPNAHTDPAFAKALREAQAAGVGIRAVDCIITPDTQTADAPVEVRLV